MAPKSTWSKENLIELYELRDSGLNWKDIGEKMKMSSGKACKKYARVDWNKFFKDPGVYLGGIGSKSYGWSQTEMAQLDAYLQADQSYEFIANKLDRSYISVERKAQTTDWKAWRSIKHIGDKTAELTENSDEKAYENEVLVKQLVDALLTVSRHGLDRLNRIKEKEFLLKVNIEKDRMPLTFNELKMKAEEDLEMLGHKNPECLELNEGTYIVVGDSHGKHTKKSMFELLKNVNRHIKPDKIIHVGHILDDDNDISYDWGEFKNLVILSRVEELRMVQDQRNKFNFSYEIIRKYINLGDLIIINQDMIQDYVRSSIGSLDSEIFDEKVIVNCHRQELFPRCSHENPSYLASAGCLCEDHIVKTIKQIDFTDGRVVKQAFHDGFIKYRRMRHMCKYWERGMLVLHVNKEGQHTIIPCSIQKTSKGFVTSYFDKMITSKGICNPEKKIFIHGDMHCILHDNKVLDIQENICKDYKPDICVNVGDTLNYSSLNHHEMDRGVAIDQKLLDEGAGTYHVLKRVRRWAKECHLMYGNHERFAQDFADKFPQFGEYLDFKFVCSIESLGYQLTKLKDVLQIGSAKFVHGDITMYGQPGSKLEKASRTFGHNVFIGHIHYPALRFGCYSVGLSGQLDQKYNEPTAQRWIHGFGLCNQYRGKSWMTTIAILDDRCILNGKTYKPTNPDSWKMKSYSASLSYDVK